MRTKTVLAVLCACTFLVSVSSASADPVGCASDSFGCSRISPIASCVVPGIGSGYRAVFGFVNRERHAKKIPIGRKNHLVGLVPQAQPTYFPVGATKYAFSVYVHFGLNVSWSLAGHTATLRASSKACDPLTVQITKGPEEITYSSSAQFTFSVSDQAATVECSLDDAHYRSCSSKTSQSYSGLKPGLHNFKIRATNASGSKESLPYSWTQCPTSEDGSSPSCPALKPITACVKKDQDGTGYLAVFGYINGGSGTANVPIGDRNQLTGDVSQSQPTSFRNGRTDYAFGAHSSSNQPVTWTLTNKAATLSTASPECDPLTVDITSGPEEITYDTNADFTFAVSLTDAQVDCSLDGSNYVSCQTIRSQTYTDLDPGSHTFKIRAKNGVGTTESEPYTWLQCPVSSNDASGKCADLKPISQCVVKDPDGTGYRAVFGYESGEPGTVTVPIGNRNHLSGDVEQVQPTAFDTGRADYAFGVHSSTNQPVVWQLAGSDASLSTSSPECQPLSVTITSGPDTLTFENDVWFTFTTNAPDASVECSLDGEAYTSCDTKESQRYSDLSVAEHEFKVRVTNATGSAESQPYIWTQAQHLQPTFSCVRHNDDGSLDAIFGYLNPNSITIGLPVGSGNMFIGTDGEDVGQPTEFSSGTYANVFAVRLNGSDVTWVLGGISVTAGPSSSSCTSPPTPSGGGDNSGNVNISPFSLTPVTSRSATGLSKPVIVTKKKCTSRRTVMYRTPKKYRLASATATVNGKRQSTRLRRGRATVRAKLSGQPKGRYYLRVKGRTTSGKRISITRAYRTCTPKITKKKKPKKKKK